MESIYRAAMQRRRARNFARRDLETALCPIVSIGNLTTGGVGKTPAVQWLARALQSEGWIVGIAARGYGGKASDAGALVSDGKTVFLDAFQAGDEPILHARNLPGAVVAIAKQRDFAVALCLDNGAQIVILDDGFQFWSLPRAFDLILLDAKNPFGNGHLLPWGRLREETAALSRADAILLTRCARATPEEIESAHAEIEKWTNAPIFASNHAPRDLREEPGGDVLPLGFLRRRDIKAFAGLADNAQFYDALKTLGAGRMTRLKRERGDHHAWKAADFAWFEDAPSINIHQAGIFNALPVVTTEKDATKLDAQWFGGPLLSLRIALEINEKDALLALITSKIGSAPPSK